MNDVSSPAHFYRWKPRDAQGRWTANLIIWIIYYHCSPLSHKADLTHFRLLIDRFLFFVSCNIGMLTMKHSGDYIRSILSRLSSHTGVRGWVDRAQQELSPAAWGGEWWLLDLVLRERRRPCFCGTRARGRDDSNSRKQCRQNDEGWINRRQDSSTATACCGQFTMHIQELAVVSGCGLTRLIWTTHSVPEIITITFLCVCSRRLSRLLPL